MATKKISKPDSYLFKVNPKSPDTIYEFTSEEAIGGSSLILEYSGSNANPLLLKNGNDLVIAYLGYYSGTGYATNITTIKDYYVWASSNQYTVLVDDGSGSGPQSVYDDATDPNIPVYAENYYQDTANDDNVFGSKQNDWYEITEGTSSSEGNDIEDPSGNDTYNVTSPNSTQKTEIMDYTGNDTYNVRKTTVEIIDDKGNDTYKAKDNANVTFSDYLGNDNYEIFDSKVTSLQDSNGNDKYTGYYVQAGSEIEDYKGNDSYTFANSSFEKLEDYEGNDTYNLNQVNVTSLINNAGTDKYNLTGVSGAIYDELGNDTYTVTSSNNLSIGDGEVDNKKSGNEKYTISASSNITLGDFAGNDSYDISYTTNFKSSDTEGNDNYKFNFVRNTDSSFKIKDSQGNDKYDLNYTSGTDSNSIEFDDYEGNDTYVVKDSDYVELNDMGNGNDKYTVSSFSYNIDIYDDDGNDIYNLSDSKKVYVSDDGDGNDTYNLTNIDNRGNQGSFCFEDENGNDKYIIKNSRGIDITDEDYGNGFGKDSYTISDSYDVTIYDEYNADTYNVTNTKLLSIDDDGEGNDIYNLTNVDNSENASYKIDDDEGDEKYTIKNSKAIEIYDNGGKDSYTISSTNGMIISDYGMQDNDKYTITDVNNLNVSDHGGNNVFTLKNVKAEQYSQIDTNGASSTYNLNNVVNMKINSYATGDKVDKYNITNSTNIRMKDSTGNDIYTLTNVINNDWNNYLIYEEKGNDIYNLKNSSMYIHEWLGDDTYTIDNLKNANKIWDEAGSNDKLTISGLNAKNVFFMANFRKIGTDACVANGDFYIFDKTQKDGFLILKDYLATRTDGGYTYYKTDGSYGNGLIETMYAGKTKLSELAESFVEDTSDTQIQQLGSAVSSWLASANNGNGYADVGTMLESGNTTDINDFISTFSTALS